jgi:hypothetical protein
MDLRKASVRRLLNGLVGRRFSGANMAADMLMFHVGRPGVARGIRRKVGTHAVHVQCPWHLARSGKIICGSAETNAVSKLRILSGRRVISIGLNRIRCLIVRWEGGYSFAAFPDESECDEFWRIIQFARGRHRARHLVYGCCGFW